MKWRLTTLTCHREVQPGIAGLYNCLFGHNFVFLSEKIYADLVAGTFKESGRDFDELRRKHFLVPAAFSEGKYLEHIKRPSGPSINLMYLLISHYCNLCCSYCFESPQTSPKQRMPWPVADRAIDFFFQTSVPDRGIIFYGGEPLLNPAVFVKAVEKIRSKESAESKACTISMVTNGTHITRELALFMAKHSVRVGVSIDGPEAIHDSVRFYKGMGTGSFRKTLRGYDYLRESGLSPTISCTIGAHNVAQLEDVARFFAADLKPSGVGFNMMLGTQDDVDIQRANQQMLRAYEILRDQGIYEDRTMRRLGRMSENQFHLTDCGAFGNQIVVRYDGQVGPCQAFCSTGEYYAGDILDLDFRLNEAVFAKWTARSRQANATCDACAASLICGGGCAYNSQVSYGDFDAIDRRVCIHSFGLLDWIITEAWKITTETMNERTVPARSGSSDLVSERVRE